VEILQEWLVSEAAEIRGQEMVKKRTKKLHANELLEFFNQVMVEQLFLLFPISVGLFALSVGSCHSPTDFPLRLSFGR
jgi:hypothetical protein